MPINLNLTKDLVVLDVETTGLSVSKDRIVQLAMIKVFADGRPMEERCRLINPEMPISKEASKLHGITDEMVADKPTFKRLAKGIQEFMGDADFLTYNGIRFDIPLLIQEFDRVGYPLDMTGRRTVDAQRIFHKMEPRTLSAAVRFYLGRDMKGAHDAGSDVRATLDVLVAQIERYKNVDFEDDSGIKIEKPIKNDIQALHDFVVDKNELDFQGKVVLNQDGVAVFSFGKYQGKPVGESMYYDHKYYNWIMNGDFTIDTKRIIERLRNEFANER